MIDPHKALLEIAGLDVTEGAEDFRARYLRKHGAGRVAEKVWNDPSFTLGFEYGLMQTCPECDHRFWAEG